MYKTLHQAIQGQQYTVIIMKGLPVFSQLLWKVAFGNDTKNYYSH